ncbi:MAG: hypothetical protein WAO24_06690 [Peptococcia bacterium]
MNNYQKAGTIVLSFFAENPFFRLLLPFDNFIIYLCLGVQYLLFFFNFGRFGSFLSALTFYGLILGLLFTFAKQHNKLLSIGLFLFAANALISVIRNLTGYYWFIYWTGLFRFAILLFLAIKTYQYQAKLSTGQTAKNI